MKAKFLTFIVLGAFWSAAFFLPSCGKKDETTTTTQDTNKTNQQQQTIQQNTQQQNTQQQTVKKDSVKTDDKKKEEDKKKQEEDKKKEEEKKKQEEIANKDKAPSVDFAAIWPKKCAKCHGKDGKGKVEGVPDLTSSEVKNTGANKLKSIIENGKKGKTDDDEDMPSFKGKLTDEEIDAAVKYVKGL